MRSLSSSITTHKRNVRNGNGNDQEQPADTMILVQHTPTYTIGRGFRWARDGKHFKSTSNSEDTTEPLDTHEGVPVFAVERGGDVTWHGPGQLTVYFVVDLENSECYKKDLRGFIESLETVVINALKNCVNNDAVKIGTNERNHGVWVSPPSGESAKKIAAVGISCNRWVTMHGVGINIDRCTADGFEPIWACGIEELDDKEREEGVVTCLKDINGACGDMNKVKMQLVKSYEEYFGVEAKTVE